MSLFNVNCRSFSRLWNQFILCFKGGEQASWFPPPPTPKSNFHDSLDL